MLTSLASPRPLAAFPAFRGVALSYNPTPSTPLGLKASVASSWGRQATSRAEAL